MITQPLSAHPVANLVMILGTDDELGGRVISRRAAMPPLSECRISAGHNKALSKALDNIRKRSEISVVA